MKRFYILPALILCMLYTTAQECNDAILDDVPGAWKPGMAGTIRISGADLVKAKSVTAFADNMMRPGFNVPKGLLATNSTAYFGNNSSKGNTLAQYNYTDWFQHYMCYNNKPRINPDAQIILRITINDPDITFSHDVLAGEWEEKDKDRYGWLDNFPVQKDGIIYMRATPDSAHFTRKPDRWLLTYEGMLPYSYVSRLEYLQKLKAKLLLATEKGIADVKQNTPIRPKAVQNQEKEEMLKKLKDDAAKGFGDWTERYLKNYKTDEALQEENIRSLKEMYAPQLQKVEAFLQKPEKELQQPAVVSNNGEFKGFLNEGDVGAVILVKENPAYFNNKLGKAVPQIIFVSLTRYAGSKKENYTMVYQDLIKRLDLQKLRGLLGK